MSFFKKVVKDASKTTENLVGNMASSNAQNATNAAVDGMDLFRWKIGTPIIQNGHFDQQKGNLFEYIEAAKFNADAASKGMSAKDVVTDVYDQGAAADILIKDGGRVQKEINYKHFICFWFPNNISDLHIFINHFICIFLNLL